MARDWEAEIDAITDYRAARELLEQLRATVMYLPDSLSEHDHFGKDALISRCDAKCEWVRR